MVNINELEDDCLGKIFNNLSLLDCLSVECVCQRWQHLVTVFRYQKLNSLKLFASMEHLQQYCNDEWNFYQHKLCANFAKSNDILIIECVDSLMCRLLVSKFMQLKLFLVSGCKISERNLCSLLDQWKYSLECLSIINLTNTDSTDIWNKPNYKYSSVIFLPKPLKHLTWIGGQWCIKHVVQSIKQQLNLDHLEELYLAPLDKVDFAKFFHQKNLRHFGCINGKQLLKHITPNNISNELSTGLSHLSVNSPGNSTILIKYICVKFAQLVLLDLIVDDYGLSISNLSLLSQLTLLKVLRLRANVGGNLYHQTESGANYYDLQLMKNASVHVLHLDIDFESTVFDMLAYMFPSVQQLTINVSRICCLCADMPDIIDNRSRAVPPPPPHPDSSGGVAPNSANPQPTDPAANANDHVQPPANGSERTSPATNSQTNNGPPPTNVNIDESTIVEEDNCEACCEQVILGIPKWTQLQTLAITGERCKDVIIKSLKHFSGTTVNYISFTACTNYSLRLLLNVCYHLAQNVCDRSNMDICHQDHHQPQQQQPNDTETQQASKTFTLKIGNSKFCKIINLRLKPKNLHLINADPIVTTRSN